MSGKTWDLHVLKAEVIPQIYMESYCIYFALGKLFCGQKAADYINNLKKYELIKELIHD